MRAVTSRGGRPGSQEFLSANFVPSRVLGAGDRKLNSHQRHSVINPWWGEGRVEGALNPFNRAPQSRVTVWSLGSWYEEGRKPIGSQIGVCALEKGKGRGFGVQGPA